MRVAPHLVRLLGSVLSAPDMVFSLEGPADLIASRKGELPPHEVERQLRSWRDLAPRVAPTIPLSTTGSVDDSVAEAREHIVQTLEARSASRIGSGWLALPGAGKVRFLLPRGPSAVATTGLQVFQPMTIKGRLAWETARRAAGTGAFRLWPRRQAPGSDVREILSAHIPRGGTVALQKTNHEDRWVALVIDRNGQARALIKLSTARDGGSILRREADNIERFGNRLIPPMRPPRVLETTSNALVLEPVDWCPRRRPWELPESVAYALGRFAYSARGEEATMAHGDFAPWNLLLARDGWVLLDWENAGSGYSKMFDLFHYLVQSHCLLGRPTEGEILVALDHGQGTVARAIASFASGVDGGTDESGKEFVRYLEISKDRLDPAFPEHRRAIAARDRLLAARRSTNAQRTTM